MLFAQMIEKGQKELKSAIDSTQEAKWYRRLKIVDLSAQGHRVPELAQWFDLGEASVRRYIKQYNEGGLNALQPGKSKGQHVSIRLSKTEWEEWYNQGKVDYPKKTSILILCDGGGSNSSRYYILKEDFQKLADEIGVEIRIAHYPPYCSKYNPIEHRLFPHVTRACQGVIFKTTEIVKKLMEKTSTTKGSKTIVQIVEKVYELKRKVANGIKDNMQIIFAPMKLYCYSKWDS